MKMQNDAFAAELAGGIVTNYSCFSQEHRGYRKSSLVILANTRQLSIDWRLQFAPCKSIWLHITLGTSKRSLLKILKKIDI